MEMSVTFGGQQDVFFESHCRYMHVEDHKGVDLAKVRAKYGTHL